MIPLCFGSLPGTVMTGFADQLDPLFTPTERKRGRLWLSATCAQTLPSKRLPWVLTKTRQRAAQFHAQQWLPAGKLVSRRRALLEVFLPGGRAPTPAVPAGLHGAGDAYLEGSTANELPKSSPR